jgi:hypothetical protein
MLVKTRDGLRMAADSINDYLETLAPPGVKGRESPKSEVDLTRIAWQQTDGSKGPYELADDPANPEFQKLSQILAEHKGKMRIGTFFVWRFTEGTKIGRKRRQ